MSSINIPIPTLNEASGIGAVSVQDDKAYEVQRKLCLDARLSEEYGVTTVDIRKCMTKNPFYVNSKEPIETWVGCHVKEHKKHDGYTTYEITPKGDLMMFDHI